MMDAFFSSGRAVDVVLLVLLAEALWLKWQGRDWAMILGALMPAVLMMLALRGALTGASWPMIALPLALSFPIHLYDMRQRSRLGD
ncbi:MAG: hypothetical protein AAGH53_08115 [Pseudomonadota bacterium]